MRRVLGMLHAPDESEEHAPQPGLAAVDELVQRVRSAGLKVTLSTEGDPPSISSGLDLTVALCVDDGQLLNDASAALVHQLAVAGEAFVVVTLRREARVPDALRALWKDELCPLVELAPLERAHIASLLARALGGPVDGASATALWELTRGNALFLRELVLYYFCASSRAGTRSAAGLASPCTAIAGAAVLSSVCEKGMAAGGR